MKTKIVNFLREYKYTIITLFLGLILLLGCVGCVSRVHSLTDSGRMIDSFELDAEVQTFIAKAQQRYKSLERQEQIRSAVMSAVLKTAGDAGFNPFGVITTLGSLVSIGAITDNVRKRKELANLQAKFNELSEIPPA